MANGSNDEPARGRLFRTPGGLIVLLGIWRLLHRNVERGKHTLIIGPTGTGKTRLAIEAGRVLGRPVEVFHFGGIFDPEVTLTGTTVLQSGETRFVQSRFVEAVTRPGCVIVADEINRASGGALNALLSFLDWQGRIAVDLDQGERRLVERAPGVVLLATANIGPEYVQTGPLDAALLDRMHIVRLGFPPNEQALVEECGVGATEAARMVRIVYEVREGHERGQLPATVSTRSLLEAAELVRDGFPMETAFETVVPALDVAGVAALRAIVKATR